MKSPVIRHLDILHCRIRLRKPIRHASYERRVNQTLIVRCELSDGTVGWGEGLPRLYVTGETTEGLFAVLGDVDLSFLRNRSLVLDEIWAEIASLGVPCPEELPAWQTGFGNSLRSALELAVLDAVTRFRQISVQDVVAGKAVQLGVAEPKSPIRYSGVVTSSFSPGRQYRSILKMKLFGFSDVKIKVGAADVDDQALLRRCRRVLGRRVSLRADGNESWHVDEAVEKIGQLADAGIQSVEQPIPASHWKQLPELRRQIGIPLMLDESLCSIRDADVAIESLACDAFNIRISKCGGILNSLKILQLALQHGLTAQLGCLVGETSVLSAAGRHVACAAGPFTALEGSYDRFVLADNLVRKDLTFRYGGHADLPAGVGLGIEVNDARVLRQTITSLRCF